MAFSNNLKDANIIFEGDLGNEPIGFEDTNFFDPGITIPEGTGLGGTDPFEGVFDPNLVDAGVGGTFDEPLSTPDAPVSVETVNDVDITTTESGDVLGLEDLKNTSGYLDWAEGASNPTGQGYLDWLAGEQARTEALQGEVDDVFASGENLLDQSEAALRASEGDLLTNATTPFDIATSQAETAAAEGSAAFGTGLSDVGQGEQTLLASARRLFDELQRRNRQQFGGSELSSAARGASELGARSLQQSLGNIQTTTQNAINTLKENLINFENGVTAKLQELDLMKNNAIAQANIAFRDALAAIDAQRAQLASNKAIAKLDALRAYRDQLFNVDLQANEFRQQIELMREQARINANQTLSQISNATNLATSSTDAITSAQLESGKGIAAAQSAGSRVSQEQGPPSLLTGRVGEEEDTIGGNLLSLA